MWRLMAHAEVTAVGYAKGTWLDLEHRETVSRERVSFLLNALGLDLCLAPAACCAIAYSSLTSTQRSARAL